MSSGWNNNDKVSSVANNLFATQSAGFGHDANDRLASVCKSGDNQSFVLDAVGNRTAHSRAGSSWSYAPQTSANRLASASGSTSRSFIYDGGASGEMLLEYSANPTNFVWLDGELVGIGCLSADIKACLSLWPSCSCPRGERTRLAAWADRAAS